MVSGKLCRPFKGIGGAALWMVRGAVHGAGLPMSKRPAFGDQRRATGFGGALAESASPRWNLSRPCNAVKRRGSFPATGNAIPLANRKPAHSAPQCAHGVQAHEKVLLQWQTRRVTRAGRAQTIYPRRTRGIFFIAIPTIVNGKASRHLRVPGSIVEGKRERPIAELLLGLRPSS